MAQYQNKRSNNQHKVQYPDGVTRINVYPFNGKGSTVAFASICVNDAIVMRGIRLVDGRNGMFLSFPQSKRSGDNGKDDEYFDIFYPCTKEFRQELEEAIIGVYENL